MRYDYDFAILLDYLPALAKGFLVTVELSVLSVAVGIAAGFLLALARISRYAVLRHATRVLVEFVRGVPVLIQLFWIFFCLPRLVGFEIGAFVSAFFTLALYMSVLASESFRAAFSSIERDQHDACVALGLPAHVRALYVVLPQAALRAIPTLLSNAVTVFKESAIVSAVGMVDIMFVGRNISSATGHPVEVLTAVAATYFIFAFPLTRAVSMLEARLLQRIKA